jgi:hypothetical protein
MVRLLLGLLIACGLLYGGYRGLRSGSPPPATEAQAARRAGVALPTGGPGAARAVVNDYQKIEAQNRAALERTLNAAQGTEPH